MVNTKFKWVFMVVLVLLQNVGISQKSILDEDIPSLVKAIRLNTEETILNLKDYFNNPETIQSLNASSKHVQLHYDKVKQMVSIHTDADMPVYSWLNMLTSKGKSNILLKRNQKQFVRFVFKEMGGKSPDKIFLKASFNNWSPDANAMSRNAGSKEWVAELWLDPGTHAYKYVVDGIEMNDPYNPDQISNGMGGSNSVVYIKGADPKSLPLINLNKFDKLRSSLNISVKNTKNLQKENIYVLWENEKLDFKLNNKLSCIEIKIPNKSKQYKRSFIRIYSANEPGAGNDLMIPLQYNKILENSSLLTRTDWQSMILYFSMVDRFNNGDKTNDMPLKDDRLLPIQNYNGGDIKGITEKILSGYFDSLGMNTIWMSPITQNPWEAYQEFPQPRRWYSGYHGYWPMLTTSVDKRFGNEKDLHELVETAHAHQMNVLLDYVCHHVHITNKMYQEHKDWATPLHLPDGRTNIRIWDEQRLTTWFDDFLPTLDLSKPEVAQIQSDSALFWIKKYKLDGFRHDATKHVPTEFWRTLTSKMKTQVELKENRPVFQIGETFGNNELISSYLGPGLLDAQFNFNLYFDARDQFSIDNGDMSIIANSLRQSCDYFGYNNTMGVITGNHDLTRFMGLASKAVRPDEDPKEAGYNRKIEIIDRKGFDKLQMLLAFIMTVPGIPIVYYGDEIGMVGAGDPDNRRPMRFENLDKDEVKTKEICAELAKFRTAHLALTYGNLEILNETKNMLVYKRTYLNDSVWICFNTSDADQTFQLDKTNNNLSVFGDENRVSSLISIPSHSFKIFYAQF